MYIVIMCGGAGKRFWPKSRESFPKQFLKLKGKRSLLAGTFERARKLTSAKKIFVVTHERFIKLIKRDIPSMQSRNIIAEPDTKNTAPCVAYSLFYLKSLHKDEPILFIPADHLIEDMEGLKKAVCAVGLERVKGEGTGVVFGIRPRYPETGYGYIRKGELLEDRDGVPVYRVEQFKEKPSADLAGQYVAGGEYLWNSGIYLFRMDKFESALRRNLPSLYSAFSRFDLKRGNLKKLYAGLDPVSIDNGIAEKERNLEVVEASFSWSDVGSWKSLSEIWPTDEKGNAVRGKKFLADSEGIVADTGGKLLVSLGAKNLVIVETADIIFVCDKRKIDGMKGLLEEMKKKGLSRYL